MNAPPYIKLLMLRFLWWRSVVSGVCVGVCVVLTKVFYFLLYWKYYFSLYLFNFNYLSVNFTLQQLHRSSKYFRGSGEARWGKAVYRIAIHNANLLHNSFESSSHFCLWLDIELNFLVVDLSIKCYI